MSSHDRNNRLDNAPFLTIPMQRTNIHGSHIIRSNSDSESHDNNNGDDLSRFLAHSLSQTGRTNSRKIKALGKLIASGSSSTTSTSAALSAASAVSAVSSLGRRVKQLPLTLLSVTAESTSAVNVLKQDKTYWSVTSGSNHQLVFQMPPCLCAFIQIHNRHSTNVQIYTGLTNDKNQMIRVSGSDSIPLNRIVDFGCSFLPSRFLKIKILHGNPISIQCVTCFGVPISSFIPQSLSPINTQNRNKNRNASSNNKHNNNNRNNTNNNHVDDDKHSAGRGRASSSSLSPSFSSSSSSSSSSSPSVNVVSDWLSSVSCSHLIYDLYLPVLPNSNQDAFVRRTDHREMNKRKENRRREREHQQHQRQQTKRTQGLCQLGERQDYDEDDDDDGDDDAAFYDSYERNHEFQYPERLCYCIDDGNKHNTRSDFKH